MTTTARQLRDTLANVPDHYLVVIATGPADDEHSPLALVDTTNIRYHADTPTGGRITYLDNHEHSEADIDDTIPAIVLTPCHHSEPHPKQTPRHTAENQADQRV